MGEMFYNNKHNVLVVAVRQPVTVGISFQVFSQNDSCTLEIANSNALTNIRKFKYIFICKLLMYFF